MVVTTHEAHIAKLFDSIESIFEKYPCDMTPETEDRAQLEDNFKQLEHKATELSDIYILDTIEEEHE